MTPEERIEMLRAVVALLAAVKPHEEAYTAALHAAELMKKAASE